MQPSQCDQPWFEMQIEYNGKVRCCCYWTGAEDAFDPAAPFAVETYWNSAAMRLKRRVIASGEPRRTGCEGCQYMRLSSQPRFLPTPDWLDERQRRNYREAVGHYERRDEEVRSKPVKYYVNFGLACNLDCIMCVQTPDREGIEGAYHVPAAPVRGSGAEPNDALFAGKTFAGYSRPKDRRQVPVDLLTRLKPDLTAAAMISIIGGEPLGVPSSVDFIDHMGSDPDYANVLLEVYTNGVLLDRRMDKLLRMRRVGIVVSLDSSVPDVYEYVRRRARWADVERNLLEFKEAGSRDGRQWRVNISGVVMKSTIRTLPEFVEWCIRHDFPVHFVPMQSMTRFGLNTDPEDVFRYPGLLDSVPGWEDKFLRAQALLEKRSWGGAGLSILLADLRRRRLDPLLRFFPAYQEAVDRIKTVLRPLVRRRR